MFKYRIEISKKMRPENEVSNKSSETSKKLSEILKTTHSSVIRVVIKH